MACEWIKLGHIFEGTGGFSDGTYLVPHPREFLDYSAANPVQSSRKLLERRAIARYENFGRRLVETKLGSLFRACTGRGCMSTAEVYRRHRAYTPIANA